MINEEENYILQVKWMLLKSYFLVYDDNFILIFYNIKF